MEQDYIIGGIFILFFLMLFWVVFETNKMNDDLVLSKLEQKNTLTLCKSIEEACENTCILQKGVLVCQNGKN